MTTLGTPMNVRPGPARLVRETGAAPRSLASAVQASVRAIESATLRSAARHDGGLAFRPKVLLALLTYCYAHQIYGSAQVENLMRHEVNLRQLCDELPDAEVLRSFRRDNTEALHGCLTAALRFLAEQKVAQGLLSRVNEVQLAEEARRRIIMAAFTDSMELDGQPTAHAPVDLFYLFANGSGTAH